MLQPDDKIYRNVEHGLDDSRGQSPMDPPKSYELPEQDSIAYEDYHPIIQGLLDDHKAYLNALANFEIALMGFKENGYKYTPEISKYFKEFFKHVDEHTSSHNHKEEKLLFPLLRERLIDAGECSPGLNPTTPTDVMEEDHVRVLQSAYLVFNLLGLGAKLTDETSRILVLQNATEQGREIVEIMKLHIYKENNVLFPLAKKLIKPEEFEEMAKKSSSSGSVGFEV